MTYDLVLFDMTFINNSLKEKGISMLMELLVVIFLMNSMHV